jgi:hypothetical protein
MTTQHPTREAGQRYRGNITGSIVTVIGPGEHPKFTHVSRDDNGPTQVCLGNGFWDLIDDSGRVPPLESKPAETGKPSGYCGKTHPCMGGVFGSFTCNRTDKHEDRDCKWHADRWSPPKAPPVQEAPKVPAKPPCRKCGQPGSAIEWCDPCWCGYVTWLGSQSGKPYAGPERIDRRLAHVSGMHDDDLVGR